MTRLLLALAVAAPLPAQSPDSVIRLLERATLPAVTIVGEPRTGAPLAERMAYYRTPAASVAVIDGGTIAWTRAWGVADRQSGRPATPITLFQAASISKPVAATAALTLVEQGRLQLDADVNQHLSSWQVPTNTHANGQTVTLRRLLTHTAGLTVHGFPGYARSGTIPSAVQVLQGGGNTAPVAVDTTPGAIWRYSGGGYTVAQQLMVDVTGMPFATLMQQRVLAPLRMTRSTYAQPLPQARWTEAATGYRPSGEPVEEDWHVYPEQAAAGLWTTPEDLARWGLAILSAYNGESGGVLSPAMARQMLTATTGNYGLGPALSADGKSFGHGGSNEGFRCQITVFFDGRGAVVMTNSDVGGLLIREVLGTLAAAYRWPAFQPIEKTVVTLPAATLAEITGTYRFPGDNSDGVISLDGTRLFLSHIAVGRVELLPESDQILFSRDDGGRITVVRENGRVVAILAFGRRAEKRETRNRSPGLKPGLGREQKP